MKGLPFVLLFTAMTFLSWGAYGPVLHHGAMAFDHDSMRAFVGVGVAYFLIAVLIPFFILHRGGEPGKWTFSGAVYSLLAGTVGAIGALGIILALGYGGKTVYVMPLVFGFAPVVNTLVTAALSGSFGQIRPIFVIGIVLAALGAGGVLSFKPTGTKTVQVIDTVTNEPTMPIPSSRATEEAESAAQSEGDDAEAGPEDAEAGSEEEEDATEASAGASDSAPDGVESVANEESAPAGDHSHEGETQLLAGATAGQHPEATPVRFWGVLFSIVIAAFCWGSYGPVLHIGQGKMAGSRLRPFACVGIAYFIIAVAAPLLLIYSRTEDTGAWTAGGMTWSFLAGVAGAIGALGVILAFTAGGKPYYVMPLIFGFAPVINTFISLSESGTWSLVEFRFWISLAVVITGAVIVLVTAPRAKPKAPPTAPA